MAQRRLQDVGVEVEPLGGGPHRGHPDERIDEGVFPALSVEASVAARASHGGTAPSEVRKRVAEARAALGME